MFKVERWNAASEDDSPSESVAGKRERTLESFLNRAKERVKRARGLETVERDVTVEDTDREETGESPTNDVENSGEVGELEPEGKGGQSLASNVEGVDAVVRTGDGQRSGILATGGDEDGSCRALWRSRNVSYLTRKEGKSPALVVEEGKEEKGDKVEEVDDLGLEDDGVDDRDGNRPMDEVAQEWGLDVKLTQNLREEGIEHFFPIQVRVVPDIVATERHSHVQSRDICVSAPTGSGKTLVYVLGVLQALMRRRVVRLRALVILPSRDLAMQVHQVFRRVARGTGLRVGVAIGQTDFLKEQLSLVGRAALAGNPVAAAKACSLRVTDVLASQGSSLAPGTNGVLQGGTSEVDIVVATPGRLLDHLAHTPGFTLQHLRYLVIDEADRLLNQSYQGWVGKVLGASYRREAGLVSFEGAHYPETTPPSAPQSSKPPTPPLGVHVEPVTIRSRPLATGDRAQGATVATPPLRKMLFSATLTNNPQKLASLEVLNPVMYSAREKIRALGAPEPRKETGQDVLVALGGGGEGGGGERPLQKTQRSSLEETGVEKNKGRFSTPATLEELYTVCDSQSKPLVLLSLLLEAAHSTLAVVFTSSVDSTHRLSRLLQLFGGFKTTAGGATANGPGDGGVAEFSSQLSQKQRTRIVKRARSGDLCVIVCSDGMARGMDLEGVGLVVNYDVPSHAKTYIHRVGRTARAGCRGTAVTIAKQGQERRFLRMRAKVDSKKVSKAPPPDPRLLMQLTRRYQECLEDLKEVLDEERSGRLCPWDPVGGRGWERGGGKDDSGGLD